MGARRIFEFSGEERFWVVAENKEQANKCMSEDLGENEDEFETREVSKDEHFNIADETEYEIITADIWEVAAADEKEGLEMPYMIATTIW